MSVRPFLALLVYQSILHFSAVSVAHAHAVDNAALPSLGLPTKYVLQH